MKLIGINLNPQYIAKQLTAWGLILGFLGGVLTSLGVVPMLRSEFVAYAAQDYSEKCIKASAALQAAVQLLEFHKNSSDEIKQSIRINIATLEQDIKRYCNGYS